MGKVLSLHASPERGLPRPPVEALRLYLSYGTQAGHPRDYLELARELWRLKAQGAG
ncbi:hypothetical protein [Calidithermus roseus]|uniref:Uncharacterized protein n=1 Tax=Calidithermus roseus TaxID=1644118 RepID=A0A399ER10_9DEIN|nr:hypothetical protein [Calidithermus roseus]RIH86388.1 hypothetical protein Mrose_01801 [Calidithermus roseus]